MDNPATFANVLTAVIPGAAALVVLILAIIFGKKGKGGKK